ncbi:hypothetical protein LIER_13710 [Lithospermum erythrorhizon]|uniref:Uncharacterized protein n=1 Tax=Lithospermum erythrorhizon TaxID=34254 RepID=A0AAV3Q109_LITER
MLPRWVLLRLSFGRYDAHGGVLPHLLLTARPEGWLLYFTVRTNIKGFCEAFSSKVEPDTWRPFFFYASGEGLQPDVPSSFMAHLKSNSALPRSVKHKADAHACSTYWKDKSSMPFHFYTDCLVLKAAGLFPIADADPRVLEALRPPAPTPEPVLVGSSFEEDEALSPLLRRIPKRQLHNLRTGELKLLRVLRGIPHPRHLLLHGTATKVRLPQLQPPLKKMLADNVLLPWYWSRKIMVVLVEQLPRPLPLSLSRFRSLVSWIHLFLLGGYFPPGKRLGSPLYSSWPSQFLRSFLALQSYKDLLSSYEAASGSFSRVGQLEGELKVLKVEKAREEGALQRILKTLAREHSIPQERYGASTRRTEAMGALLEGMQAKRDPQ